MASHSADALFERYFWPHYPPDVRADPSRFRDEDANPAANPELLAHLREGAELFVANAPRLLGTDALTFDEAGVARLSSALDRAKRDAWLSASDPRDSGNPFFNAVVHAALYVGEVCVRAHGGAWSMRRPMWESLVTLPRARGQRVAIAPFHWLLKHLSDDEIDRGSLAYRFHVHVAMATRDVSALPRIMSPRKLPVLKQPTYDLLVKYLHQHLPDLKDLGEGFPTALEFTERAYSSVSFQFLHEGRVLAMHGQTPSRGEQPSLVEVLWLTKDGFDHADSLPADDHPPYFARPLEDAALEVTLAWKARPHTHTLTFRGHA